jgi:uncharacterized protein YfaS (alpha-2-macroglobulin family)
MRLAFGGGLWPVLILPIAILSPYRGSLANSAVAQDGNSSAVLEILKYDLAANQDVPELCFTLSGSLSHRSAQPLESFVAVEPGIPLSATPRRDRLCLTGFAFGAAYTVSFKAGLPGVSGTLQKDAQFRVEIPNRPPEFAFAAPEGSVLPRIGNDGLPIRSVNVRKIEIRIFRMSDDNLRSSLSPLPLTVDEVRNFAPGRGERIWEGAVDVKGDANRDTLTMLPLEQTIGALKPGLYVAAIAAAGTPTDGQVLPTQYFTVSDLGLSAFRGPSSLLIAARSLSSAAASPGIDIALVAANNRELGRVRTDGNGFARFDPNLLRGADGDRPASIFAYGPAGEFATLDLAADVSEGSRPTAVLIHADRAVYWPGEVVNILALARSDQGTAVPKQPLTVDIYQPNGAIFSSQTLTDQGAGAYNVAAAIPESGSDGTWRIEARGNPAEKPIGSTTFEVGDSRSTRLNLALNADVAVLDPSQPANIAVQAQYPEAQAANVPGELRVAVAAASAPFPAFPGFSFGLADESVRPLTLDPLRFTTDGAGKAVLPVKFTSPPKSTRPLEAQVSVRMFDAGGQAVEHAVSVPVGTQNLMLGVKPQPTILANQSAHFEMIAVGPDGARQEKAGAGWEIVRQDSAPSWYWDGRRFAYRPSVKDNHVASGTVDIPANGPAMLDVSLPSGRYRIELFDLNGEAISSAHFTVGWSSRDASDPVDKVSLKSTKTYFSPGDTADVFVQPPFDADVVLASADPQIRETAVQHVPAAGATMHLAIPRDAGLGMQLLATAIAPPDPSAPALTRRAFGQTPFLSDPAPRNLDVKLDLPETVMPQRTLSVPVNVSGAGDEPVYVRVSAIDERSDAVLLAQDSLLDPLIGRQLSAVSALDNYGRIIVASGLSNGGLKDEEAPAPGHATGSGGRKPTQAALGLYSGIVTLDKAGKGNVLLTLPDFAGVLKVKALAWSASRSGQGEAALAVRYPLNTILPLPAFLTPDDHADIPLQLDNADGPRGEYHVTVKGEGAVAVQSDADTVFNLAEHEQRTQLVSVQARGPGDGAIILAVKGPNGISFERHLPLPVRPAAAAITRHGVVTLKAGGTLTLDPALTGGIRPESLSYSLTATGGNDFDLGGIAQDLMSSDHDSAEQNVDAAMPYLAPPTLLQALGVSQQAPVRLGQAVQSLASYQSGDGGFSLFGSGQSDPWLTAYVVDFLSQAKSRGAAVPDVVVRQALDYLVPHMEPSATDPAKPDYPQQALATAAYVAKVLAANDRLNLFQLRYFSDRFQSQMRNPVATALVAAAFASLGDKTTSTATFARAGSLTIDPALADLFGSDLRDQAMLTALMAESGTVAPPTVAANIAKTAAIVAARRQFSTQEAAWVFRAAAPQPASAAGIRLKVGDKTVAQSGPFTTTIAGQPLPGIKNTGDAAVRIAATVTGSPGAGDAKDQAGYEVQRWFFDTSGKAIDPGALRQGDIAVVVLTGRFTGQGEAHPLLSDTLSSGWEIEAAEIADPANRYPWLKDLTGSSHVAVSNGRYVAVPRLAGDRHEFKLAYVARAAVRGQFNLPGTVIEDMAQPALTARAVGGRTKIDPPS